MLWERTARPGGELDWRWPDARLARLRELGVRPIVGLLHHGPGPLAGGIEDARFAEAFAAYARAVAERYPWVDAYVPINEPLTTARFCGLYGIWHPHGADPRVFGRLLANQVRATALAMRAIRDVNPAAELVQNEDLGTVYSTPALAYQAEHENDRRWLTFDLLFGRVTPEHPMWRHLRACGLAGDELWSFIDEPCVPDVVGVDHYITSDRMLDGEWERYPLDRHGGNDRERYANVEAARARAEPPGGIGPLLRLAHERYGADVAVTEAHMGSTREEQLRWLWEIWRDARGAHDDGVPVRGVAVWSLFGAYDWNSLLRVESSYYEPGAFDVRGPEPRATATAELILALAAGEEPDHPVLDAPGWWRRPGRHFVTELPIVAGAVADTGERLASDLPAEAAAAVGAMPRPIAVLEGHGEDAALVGEACDARALARAPIDPDGADGAALARALRAAGAWAVVLAGVDAGDEDAGEAALRVADAAAATGLPLLVFAGDGTLDVAVATADTNALVVRSDGSHAAVDAALDLLIDGASGVWDVAGGVPVAAPLPREAAVPVSPPFDETPPEAVVEG